VSGDGAEEPACQAGPTRPASHLKQPLRSSPARVPGQRTSTFRGTILHFAWFGAPRPQVAVRTRAGPRCRVAAECRFVCDGAEEPACQAGPTWPASHLKQPLRPLPQEFRVREPAPSAALYPILHGLGRRDPSWRAHASTDAAWQRNAASFPFLQDPVSALAGKKDALGSRGGRQREDGIAESVCLHADGIRIAKDREIERDGNSIQEGLIQASPRCECLR
jgi:hypothetical protein